MPLPFASTVDGLKLYAKVVNQPITIDFSGSGIQSLEGLTAPALEFATDSVGPIDIQFNTIGPNTIEINAVLTGVYQFEHMEDMPPMTLLGNLSGDVAHPDWLNLSNVATALLPDQSGHDDEVLSTDGSGNLSWIPNGSGGSGIASLNSLTASSQTFASANDTNVTLSIGSLTSTHTFTMGWTGTLSVARGGTGASTATGAINTLLPSQSSNAGKFLQTDGTNVSWQTAGSGSGTVTNFIFTNANGISGSVSTSTTTPTLSLSLGAITPSTVNGLTLAAQSVGFTIAGGTTSKTLTVPLDASVSGTNTGDLTLAGENYLSIASQVITANAVNLSNTNVTGTLAAARFPALTGDLTNTVGTLATTVGAIQNKAITLATGYLRYTGSAWAFDNSTFLTSNQTITLSGDVSGSGATSISVTLATVTPAKGGTGLTSYTKGDLIAATGAATLAALAVGSNGQVLSADSSTSTGLKWIAAGGVGTVTSVDMTVPSFLSVSGNPITAAGTLAITLTSQLQNLIFASPNGSSGTPTFRSIVSADVPTLNQSTTGSAATLTTPRTIYGNNFDGSAALTQIIASTFGGTGNGFTKFSGPTTSEKTFTLPDASSTILTSNAAVTVPQGGTGNTTFTAYAVITAGTTATGTFQNVSGLGTSGQVLTSNGAGALPTWQNAAGGGMTNPMTTTGDTIYSSDNSGTPARLAIGSTGQFLNVSGGLPAWATTLAVANGGTGQTTYTNGQLLIGNTTGNTLAKATLTGTSNQITVTNGTGSITLATPQDIATSSTPQFARLGLGIAADATAVFYGSQSIAANTNADGIILENPTAATNNNQRYSPSIRLRGNGWAGASSTVDWRITNVPTQQGSLPATARFTVAFSTGGGAYSTYLTLGGGLSASYQFNQLTAGLPVLDSNGTLSSNTLAANSILFASSTAAITGNSTDLTYTATTGMLVRVLDSGTNTTLNVLTVAHNGGTPAASFGVGLLFTLESSTTNDQNASQISTTWTTATHASRTSAQIFSTVYNAQSLTEYMRLAGTSATAMLLTLGVAGTTLGQLGISGNTSGLITLTANAAAGTWTFTLPTTAGSNLQALMTNGSGVALWGSPIGQVGGGADISTINTAGGTVYVNPYGTAPALPVAINQSNSYTMSKVGVLQNLYITSNVAPGAAKTIQVTVYKNGVATTLTATISGAVQTANQDTTHTISVAATDTISVEIIVTALTTSASVSWGFLA